MGGTESDSRSEHSVTIVGEDGSAPLGTGFLSARLEGAILHASTRPPEGSLPIIPADCFPKSSNLLTIKELSVFHHSSSPHFFHRDETDVFGP